MPIEISCNNCQAILRVADEHAGKSARCPQCSTVIPIPLTPLESPPNETSSSNESGYWNEKTQDVPGGSNPYATPKPTPNPYANPTAMGGLGLQPHRGPLILTLGITSLVCFCLFFAAIPAIIMANEDLRKMDNGIMNADGRSITTAGKVIGIVALILNGLGFLIQVLFGLLGAVVQGI